MMLRPYTEDIVSGHPDVDEIILFDEKTDIKNFSDILYWSRCLRHRQFDAVLVLYPTAKLATIMFLSGIPVRVGTGYRYYSLLFNKRVYHHRKTAERHELEYNLDLAEKIGARLGQVSFRINIPQLAEQRISRLLQENDFAEGERFIVIHPGSGGSALDWSPEKFAELGDRVMAELNIRVIVTGGPGENRLVETVIQRMRLKPLSLVDVLSLKELAALLKRASLFVGNSTGPLHLAVAVGTLVVAFYPPLTPCLPSRWGPYNQLQSVLMPPIDVCSRCKKQQCPHFNCMDLIEVESAFRMAKKLLVES